MRGVNSLGGMKVLLCLRARAWWKVSSPTSPLSSSGERPTWEGAMAPISERISPRVREEERERKSPTFTPS